MRQARGATTDAGVAPSDLSPHAAAERTVVRAVAEALLLAEDDLTELDARAGDGDLGASLAPGAQAILALPEQSYASPEQLLRAVGKRSGVRSVGVPVPSTRSVCSVPRRPCEG